MRFSTLIPALALLAGSVLALDKPLNIEVTTAKECTRKTDRGDKVKVHYRGTLEADGSEFDSSFKRDKPLEFKVGTGMVIKGWDEGLLDMCIGEARKLTIQPEYGYDARGMGPIPANSVLIFETELMGIEGVDAEKDEL